MQVRQKEELAQMEILYSRAAGVAGADKVRGCGLAIVIVSLGDRSAYVVSWQARRSGINSIFIGKALHVLC